MRVNVRCCCDPNIVIGTLEVGRAEPCFFFPKVKISYGVYDNTVDYSAVTIPKLEIARVAFPNTGAHEYAVKSGDRPDEFWDTLVSFRRGDRV